MPTSNRTSRSNAIILLIFRDYFLFNNDDWFGAIGFSRQTIKYLLLCVRLVVRIAHEILFLFFLVLFMEIKCSIIMYQYWLCFTLLLFKFQLSCLQSSSFFLCFFLKVVLLARIMVRSSCGKPRSRLKILAISQITEREGQKLCWVAWTIIKCANIPYSRFAKWSRDCIAVDISIGKEWSSLS